MPASTHQHRRTTPTRAALFPSIITPAFGCRNNCQNLPEMAAFAEEECKDLPEERSPALVQYDSEKIDEKQDEVCEEILPTLREEWTCDEIDDYFAGRKCLRPVRYDRRLTQTSGDVQSPPPAIDRRHSVSYDDALMTAVGANTVRPGGA